MKYADLIIKREKEEIMQFIYYFIRKLLNCTNWVRRKIRLKLFKYYFKGY